MRPQSAQAVVEIAFSKVSQRVVDLHIDLDPFAHPARAGAIAAFPGDAYLVDPRLPWDGFDHVDPPADLAPIFVGRCEEIRPEGDEQISADRIRRIAASPRARASATLIRMRSLPV